MARKFWPAADPIGQRVLIGHRPSPLEIIGIVGDARGVGLNAEAKPEMYTALRGFWYAFLVLRTNREPSSMASTVRDQVASLDKGVPVYRIATMDRLLSRSVAPDRFNLFLLGLFAALALVLATVGIYGVLAFGVGRRTHEIGIRLAMGAHQDDILQLVVRQGMKLVLVGIVLGIAGALALTRLMASLLYGVSATDPATFIAVTFLLVSVAMMACYVPARRAMRVDPVVALRHE
jgi:putative ABC transport system permease protein